MTHREIINRINKENERRLLRPLLIGALIAFFGVPILLILVIALGPSIDAFASRHPAIVGVSLLVLGVGGWAKFGRRNNLW